MMIDNDTRLDFVSGLGSTLTYNYTLLNSDVTAIDRASFLTAISAKVKTGVCADKGMRKDLLERKIRVGYSYSDKAGSNIGVINVSLSDCS